MQMSFHPSLVPMAASVFCGNGGIGKKTNVQNRQKFLVVNFHTLSWLINRPLEKVMWHYHLQLKGTNNINFTIQHTISRHLEVAER